MFSRALPTLLALFAIGWADTATSAGKTYRTPYAPNSAFNRPIGQSAQYTSAKARESVDAREVTWGFNATNGWSCAITESSASDPMLVVRSNDTKRGFNLPYQVRIPKGFPGSAGVPETSDGQVVIHDTTTGHTHEFYKFKWNNGKPTAAIHRTDDPNLANNKAKPQKVTVTPNQNIVSGLGHTPHGSKEFVGTRAAGTACWAGLIRTWEMTEPNTFPRHALLIELTFSQLSKNVQWPAISKDTTASENYGSINYGALIAIPPESKGGPKLEELGLSDAGLRIAKALVYYGGYVVDRSSGSKLEGDQDMPSKIRSDVYSDVNKILKKHFRIVTNNSHNQQYSGGGTALSNYASSAPKSPIFNIARVEGQ